MKLSYFADTDSLYIDLSDEPSVESREISEGVVLDYNAAGVHALGMAFGPGRNLNPAMRLGAALCVSADF